MTKKEMFATIATVCSDNAEIVEFCHHEIELLENRKSGKKGMTATQKANVGVKEAIVAVLGEVGEPITVSELMTDDRMGGFTNQKLSALLSQLVKDGRVVKTIEGKKARFALA